MSKILGHIAEIDSENEHLYLFFKGDDYNLDKEIYYPMELLTYIQKENIELFRYVKYDDNSKVLYIAEDFGDIWHNNSQIIRKTKIENYLNDE